MMGQKSTRGILALLFAFVVACTVSCATPAGRSTGTVVDDATITARVKTALLADKDVSGVAVSVDTFKGEVVLNGAVSTQAQVDKAESLARGVSGVKSVKNLIRLTYPAGDAPLPSRVLRTREWTGVAKATLFLLNRSKLGICGRRLTLSVQGAQPVAASLLVLFAHARQVERGDGGFARRVGDIGDPTHRSARDAATPGAGPLDEVVVEVDFHRVVFGPR